MKHVLCRTIWASVAASPLAAFQDFWESTISFDLRPREYVVLVVLMEMTDVRDNRLARMLGLRKQIIRTSLAS
jgi:hypothetical protein